MILRNRRRVGSIWRLGYALALTTDGSIAVLDGGAARPSERVVGFLRRASMITLAFRMDQRRFPVGLAPWTSR